MQNCSKQQLLMGKLATTTGNKNCVAVHLLHQRLTRVLRHCGGPLSMAMFSSSFQPPQNRPLIWLVVATLGRSTSQNCCNWQAAPKLQSITLFFGRYGPRRLRLQLSVPTKLIETNKHKKTAVKQRSELLNYLLQHADFVSSGCSATRRKFLSATQQK